MKPSERIIDLASKRGRREHIAKTGHPDPLAWDATITVLDVVRYLDEQAAPLADQQVNVLPPSSAAPAVKCSDCMPDVERRVLFYVPDHVDPNRSWRVGAYCCPPLYCDTEWKDEESEVGDGSICWRLDQVTHWMPMPGVPT